MDNKQDKLNKLINITDEYEGNPEIVKDAIKDINAGATCADDPMTRRRIILLAAASFLIVCILLVSILIPIYYPFEHSIKIVYYSSSDLVYSYISDIDQFKEDSGLEFNYYETGINSDVNIASDKDTGEVVFIMQDAVFICESGIDTVRLYMVVMANAEIDFFRYYEEMISTMTVSGTEVSYSSSLSSNLENLYVKFSYGNVDYYIQILTNDSSEEQVQRYVELLIN